MDHSTAIRDSLIGVLGTGTTLATTTGVGESLDKADHVVTALASTPLVTLPHAVATLTILHLLISIGRMIWGKGTPKID